MNESSSASQRIISVVPSQTELLFDLGLDEEVIGITKFCVHPTDWFRNKERIGGTKNLHLERIHALKPDLILANREENNKEQIELLMKSFQVYVSDIKTINDALQMIVDVGKLVHCEEVALKLVNDIQMARAEHAMSGVLKKGLYLIWKNPYMAAGQDTFIHEMMHACGLTNCVQENRYPSLSEDDITKLDPEIVLLSSEPFPFKQKHLDELSSLLPSAKIILVDGELFSWYGSRMLKSFEYFSSLNEKFS